MDRFSTFVSFLQVEYLLMAVFRKRLSSNPSSLRSQDVPQRGISGSREYEDELGWETHPPHRCVVATAPCLQPEDGSVTTKDRPYSLDNVQNTGKMEIAEWICNVTSHLHASSKSIGMLAYAPNPAVTANEHSIRHRSDGVESV